jgi:hypothetical protein
MNQECSPMNKTGNRNVLCPHYNDCLDYIVARSWKDWDCSDCRNKMNQESITDFPLTCDDSLPHYEIPFELFHG